MQTNLAALQNLRYFEIFLWGVSRPRAWHAHIPSVFDFLLSQPSPTAPISYDFVFFACLSFLSLCVLSFSAFWVRQSHFISRLLIFVRKCHLIHCTSIYYRVFCEGCESKKCKTPVVCVRTYAREAPQYIFFTNDNISSFVYHFFPLNGYDKGSDKKEIIPNRSLDSAQILFDCWTDCFPLVWRRSRLRRELTENNLFNKKMKDARKLSSP